MPQFQYKAVDAAGAQREGVLDAATENELIVRLSSQGLRVVGFSREMSPTTVHRPAAPVVNSSSRAPLVQPIVQAQAPKLEARSMEAPAPGMRRAAAQPIRTKRASYRDLMFLFTQLSTLLKSGISPADACTRVGGNASKPFIQEALKNMSRLTAQGHTLADAMAVYPDIFPDNAVGSIRAGETGGYTWEAADALRNQNDEARKMASGARWFRLAACFGIFGFPMVFAFVQGLDHSFATLGGLPALVQGVGQALVGPIGIWFFGEIALYLGISWWARRTENRMVRHRWGFRLPFFKERARAEALSTFAWHMGKLSATGITPNNAWKLASSAIPNEAIGEEYAAINGQSSEGTRMTEIARRSNLIPHEFASVIETGEMTGSLPQALDHTSRMAGDERAMADRRAKFSLYGAYLVLFIVIGALSGITFYTGYFNALMKHTVQEVEEGN